MIRSTASLSTYWGWIRLVTTASGGRGVLVVAYNICGIVGCHERADECPRVRRDDGHLLYPAVRSITSFVSVDVGKSGMFVASRGGGSSLFRYPPRVAMAGRGLGF